LLAASGGRLVQRRDGVYQVPRRDKLGRCPEAMKVLGASMFGVSTDVFAISSWISRARAFISFRAAIACVACATSANLLSGNAREWERSEHAASLLSSSDQRTECFFVFRGGPLLGTATK